MSASTGIAIAASVQANLTAVEASRAQDQACRTTIKGFVAEGATVPEMRTYAGCVQRMHPDPIPDKTRIAIKSGILILFLGIAAGIWWGRSTGEGSLWGAACGAVAALGGIIGVTAVALALAFLFS
jgi:hypothetical protein